MNIKWVEKKDAQPCFYVRKEVFVKEQGFSKELEFDAIDAYAHHLNISINDICVATCRLYKEKEEDTFHCGRICILKDYRSKGIGKYILLAAKEKAIELGIYNIVLSAQLQAKTFYEKNGYCIFGTIHYDEGVPHIMMKLEVTV